MSKRERNSERGRNREHEEDAISTYHIAHNAETISRNDHDSEVNDDVDDLEPDSPVRLDVVMGRRPDTLYR